MSLIHLAKLQSKALSAGLSTEKPTKQHLFSCDKSRLSLMSTEEGKEEEVEALLLLNRAAWMVH